jgi:hypothetical protein
VRPDHSVEARQLSHPSLTQHAKGRKSAGAADPALFGHSRSSDDMKDLPLEGDLERLAQWSDRSIGSHLKWLGGGGEIATCLLVACARMGLDCTVPPTKFSTLGHRLRHRVRRVAIRISTPRIIGLACRQRNARVLAPHLNTTVGCKRTTMCKSNVFSPRFLSSHATNHPMKKSLSRSL